MAKYIISDKIMQSFIHLLDNRKNLDNFSKNCKDKLSEATNDNKYLTRAIKISATAFLPSDFWALPELAELGMEYTHKIKYPTLPMVEKTFGKNLVDQGLAYEVKSYSLDKINDN